MDTVELAENVVRKDMTLKEKMARAKQLEPKVRARAKAQQQEGGRHGGQASGPGGHHGGQASSPGPEACQLRDVIAKEIGMSASAYQRAKFVITAAERDPDTYGSIALEMFDTEKITPSYRKLKQLKAEASSSPSQRKTARRLRMLDLSKKGLNAAQIAAEIGITHGNVSAWARETGVVLSGSAAAIKARRADLIAMARDDISISAISKALALSEETVRRYLHEAGVTPADQRVRGFRRVNVNRTMGGLVTFGDPAETLEMINAGWERLDRGRFAEWADEFERIASLYRGLVNKLRKELSNGNR